MYPKEGTVMLINLPYAPYASLVEGTHLVHPLLKMSSTTTLKALNAKPKTLHLELVEALASRSLQSLCSIAFPDLAASRCTCYPEGWVGLIVIMEQMETSSLFRVGLGSGDLANRL